MNTASTESDQVTTPVTDTVTTPVDAAPIIEAEPDVVAGIDSATGGMNVINVLDDDLLNGQPINPGQVTVVFSPDGTIPAGITFNADGSIDVAPGTPAGTYVIPYEICDVIDPTNCTVSNVTIIVNAPTGLAPLTVMKSTQVSNVTIGDVVPYTITVTNTEDVFSKVIHQKIMKWFNGNGCFGIARVHAGFDVAHKTSHLAIRIAH